MPVAPTSRRSRRPQDGYILITLMLMVALIAIGLGIALPELAFQVRREREGELIHRGVQYSRAIKRYYKKFGRYPTRIEELQNTNNVRFLRRAYKDPITGKDFRLLHFGQVPMGMGGMGLAGAMAAAGAAGGVGGRGATTAGMMGTIQAQAGMAAMASGMAAMQTNTSSNSPFSSAGSSDDTSANGLGGKSGFGSQSNKGTSGSDKLSGQQFGGGPIIGVTSMSKAQSIREFSSKNHYSDWNFVYDPSLDRGALITGPAEPLKGLGMAGQQPGLAGGVPGAPGQTGLGQSGFGQSGFGQNGLNQQQQQPQPPPQPAPEQQ